VQHKTPCLRDAVKQWVVLTYIPLHNVCAAVVVRQLCECWNVLSSHNDNVVQQLAPADMNSGPLKPAQLAALSLPRPSSQSTTHGQQGIESCVQCTRDTACQLDPYRQPHNACKVHSSAPQKTELNQLNGQLRAQPVGSSSAGCVYRWGWGNRCHLTDPSHQRCCFHTKTTILIDTQQPHAPNAALQHIKPLHCSSPAALPTLHS
jgi:hypothetical protein